MKYIICFLEITACVGIKRHPSVCIGNFQKVPGSVLPLLNFQVKFILSHKV